jgi:uncharacterized membrane protein
MSPITVDINQIRGLYQKGGEIMTQNRLKSKVLWIGLTSALLLLLGEWGLYEMIGIKQEVIQHTIDFILLCLTGFGVINSPDNKGTL